MKAIYLLLVLTILSAGLLFFQQTQTQSLQSSVNDNFENFLQFKKTYGKVYNGDEQGYRYENYLKAVQYIEETNQKEGKRIVKINQTADLTNEEYIARYLNDNSFKDSSYTQKQNQELTSYEMSDYPTSVDWISKGVVPSVNDISSCNASYASATAASLASIYAIKEGTLTDMSTQQIVSCDASSGACRGGYFYYSLLYTMQAGIQSEASYPYTGRKGTCEYDQSEVVFTPTDAVKIQYNNPEAMVKYIQNQPLIAEVDASSNAFRYYSGDEVFHSFCYADHETNYSVLLTGYNDVAADLPYWVLQASFGTKWGDNGYMKIKKEMKGSGMCGINTDVGFPSYDN